jgi:hypothetical protein
MKNVHVMMLEIHANPRNGMADKSTLQLLGVPVSMTYETQRCSQYNQANEKCYWA